MKVQLSIQSRERAALSEQPLVAFVGNPNCGKSTIFNALTGLKQKIGNFPGVTVEPKVGTVTAGGRTVRVIDLPGIYSLSPKTPDEEMTARVLQQGYKGMEKPEAVLFVIEGTNLEKGLFLYSQFARLGLPTIVVVTMIDAVKRSGGVLDDIALEHALGVPVLTLVGHKGIGLDEVRDELARCDNFTLPRTDHLPGDDIEERYTWARSLAADIARIPEEDTLTKKIDSVVLHPIWGPLIFLGVMLLFFQSIFTWATPLMDLIDTGFAFAQGAVESAVPEGLLQNFLSNGVLAGVGSVVVFLPQILILYLFITILEDFGYLARAAFMVDRTMGLFGLQGRAFIPLLGSFACAIPGIMSARIIPSERDRLTTILIAPIMTCSARLPVYVLLITAFVPALQLFGVINLQGVVLFGLYAVAALSGLLVAKLLKSTVFRGSKLPFLMELPPYRFPSAKSVAMTMVNRAKIFLKSAGTIILVFSIALWALSEFPRADVPAGTPELEAQRIQLEESALGQVGRTVQPIFAPMGFDWKVTIGILGSFAAREVFVSVMGQVYSADVSESDARLRDVLHDVIPLPVALAILAFYVYALQCVSTIAVMKRETGSWKWPAFAFGYMFALAYISALATYYIARSLG